MQVYLDNAATTKIDPRVLNKMKPYWTIHYGNASSIHKPGQDNELVIRACKLKIAKLLNTNADNLIFTASATEANNFIIKGVMRANQDKGNHLIISAIEHPCVLQSAQELARDGLKVSIAPVDNRGLIKLDELKKLITPQTVLVSIMTVNNEIGVIQDIKKISQLVHAQGAYFHTDAVQAVPYEKIDIKANQIDFLSLSGHKFYGPLGVGLAIVNPRIKIRPLIVGGGQEKGLRAGTYNVPGIIGFTEALILAYRERAAYLSRVRKLRDYLWVKIKQNIPEVAVNGDLKRRTPNNLNVMFARIEGEAILMDLSYKGVYVSTGSACSALNLKSSSVLAAIGLVDDNLNSNIRFSLGRYNTKKELNYTLKALKETVQRLRSFSSIK